MVFLCEVSFSTMTLLKLSMRKLIRNQTLKLLCLLANIMPAALKYKLWKFSTKEVYSLSRYQSKYQLFQWAVACPVVIQSLRLFSSRGSALFRALELCVFSQHVGECLWARIGNSEITSACISLAATQSQDIGKREVRKCSPGSAQEKEETVL